jgi:HAD superfamily hydrolase (TIGR01490 family)
VTRSAAFFDLDKTIIARSSTLAFGRPFYQGGLINRRAMLKTAYAQFVYLLGGADAEQMDRMRDHLTALAAGWEVGQVRRIVDETLHDLIDPLIYGEAAQLIDLHHAAGRDVVIVSSSGEELVVPIGAMVGADEVISTRMTVRDGRYTGEIDFYAYGEEKARAIRELATRRGYELSECFAYSDSITDVPMLEAVGHPHAVNPDRALRREATRRGWPILVFARPVSLRARLPRLPSRPALALAALTAGAALLGTAWYAARGRAAGRARRPAGTAGNRATATTRRGKHTIRRETRARRPFTRRSRRVQTDTRIEGPDGARSSGTRSAHGTRAPTRSSAL